MLGSDPWNDTPLKARLSVYLNRLAFADTGPSDEGVPSESWQFTSIALLAYAKKPSMHKAFLEVHRHYFPTLGPRRRSWAKRNKIKGAPPANRFFKDALCWITRNSTEGPRMVQQKAGASADNAIGLGRAVFAGALAAEDVNTVVMRGTQVAAVSHIVREPRNLCAYLAVLTHLWLHNEDNGARPTPMHLLIKSEMGRIAARIGNLAAVHEAVLLGEFDQVPGPSKDGKALDAAVELGRTFLGPEPTEEPWWMQERVSRHSRAFRPILYPMLQPTPGLEVAAVAERNHAVVTSLAAAGLL